MGIPLRVTVSAICKLEFCSGNMLLEKSLLLRNKCDEFKKIFVIGREGKCLELYLIQKEVCVLGQNSLTWKCFWSCREPRPLLCNTARGRRNDAGVIGVEGKCLAGGEVWGGCRARSVDAVLEFPESPSYVIHHLLHNTKSQLLRRHVGDQLLLQRRRGFRLLEMS